MAKKKKAIPWQQRDVAVISAILTAYELEEDDLDDIGTLDRYNPHVHFLRLQAQSRSHDRPGRDGAWPHRLGMYLWVEAHPDLKLAEAHCNLQCLRCPRLQSLNCGEQNRAAARVDNFTVPKDPNDV